MRLILAILLALPWVSQAQSRRLMLAPVAAPSVVVASWTPSSIGTMLAQYVADAAQTNAGGYATNLTDSGANHWGMTNWAAGTIPKWIGGGINGHALVRFDGVDDYLWSMSYASAQPHEVCCIWRFTGPTNALSYVLDSPGAPNRNIYRVTADSLLSEYSGNYIYSGAGVQTNRWTLTTLLFYGANSLIITNNVIAVTGDAGTLAPSGIMIGGASSLVYPAAVDVAEIVTFTATNTPANRSNMWWYCTNKYGASNF